MTVVATDGLTMAADGLTVCGETIVNRHTHKVHRLADGRLVGTAGSAEDSEPFRLWLAQGNQPPVLDPDFLALVLALNGQVSIYTASCAPTVIPAPAAIGGGHELALGAMDAGATPVQAVKIACRRSTTCGGTVRNLTLNSQD